MNEILAKLNAANNRAGRVLNNYPSTLPRQEVDRIYASLIFYKGKLDEIKPELFQDYSLYAIDTHLINDDRYNKMALEKIRIDMHYLIDVIIQLTDIIPANVKITKEGVYFSGQQFDALYKIGEIIEKAQREIIVIDSYLNDKIVRFMKSKNTKASLTLVVSERAYSDTLMVSVEAEYQQFDKIQVIKNNSFHDRFVILDNNEIYHFGPSLKDLEKRGFMFSVIEEESIKKNFFEQLAKEGIINYD